MGTNPPSRGYNDDNDEEEYFLPLTDQRVFGAGIKRKRIAFVRASDDETVASPPISTAQISSTAADKYLAIVLGKGGADTPELSEIDSQHGSSLGRQRISVAAQHEAVSVSDRREGESRSPNSCTTASQGAASAPTTKDKQTLQEHCPICGIPLSPPLSSASSSLSLSLCSTRNLQPQTPHPESDPSSTPHVIPTDPPLQHGSHHDDNHNHNTNQNNSRNYKHTTSIVHQISLPHSHPPSHVDRTRLGLKYMTHHGWDPDSRLGLGARMTGIRDPILPKEKRNTVGLGHHVHDRCHHHHHYDEDREGREIGGGGGSRKSDGIQQKMKTTTTTTTTKTPLMNAKQIRQLERAKKQRGVELLRELTTP